jgi:hypothetical protein
MVGLSMKDRLLLGNQPRVVYAFGVIGKVFVRAARLTNELEMYGVDHTGLIMAGEEKEPTVIFEFASHNHNNRYKVIVEGDKLSLLYRDGLLEGDVNLDEDWQAISEAVLDKECE